MVDQWAEVGTVSTTGSGTVSSPPPPAPRNRQCLTAELGGGSCTRFPPKIRPWNQGLVLAHDRGQPRTAGGGGDIGDFWRGAPGHAHPLLSHS